MYGQTVIIAAQHNREFALLKYLAQQPAGKSWSRDHAIRENQKRQKSLLKEGNHADIIEALEDCSPNSPCQSAACAVCVHYNQVGLVEEMLALFKRHKKLKHATVILPQYICKPGELHTINPAVIGKAFYDMLTPIRKAVPNLIGIACVEVVFRNADGLWYPHIHFVFAGISKKRFKHIFTASYKRRLSSYIFKKCVNIKPHRITLEGKREGDRIRVLAYLAKFTTSEVYSYRNVVSGLLVTGKRRPKNVMIENEIMRWYHTHTLKSFIIRIGHRPIRIV